MADNGSRKDGPIRKDEVEEGAAHAALSTRLFRVPLRKLVFWQSLRWAWMLAWLTFLLALIMGFMSAMIVDAFEWSRGVWEWLEN
jgi:hypothetical protein